MASAAIARLPLLLALGLAPFARTSAKDVTAKFEAANPSAASVRGTVTFSQPTAGAPVQVSVTLAGLQHGPNSWYIHSYPVTGQDCSNSSVGVQSQQLGDLTGSSVTKVATDSDITLFGPGSIVGRSIVLHKSTALGGSRWACATIGQARAVTASFTKDSEAAGPLRGYITFTQVEDGPAVVDVSLNGLVYGPNAWHVHKWPVTGGDCSDSSVSGHYNPTGFDGELEMRHSSLPNVPHFKAQYIDTELTLFGSASIVGRSIVIHKASVGAPRWVCATIGEARTVTATFAHSEPASQSVRGAVVFTQVEHGPTVVDVRLAGLDHGGAAGNPWHVHSFPVTDGQCSATSVGGHYNPTGRPTQGELSLNLGNLQYTAAASVMDQQVWKQYVDDAITLFGPDSIVGRSVVIHKNDATKSRWACTTIGEKKVVTALFTDQPSSTDGGIFGGSTVPTDGSGSIYSRPSAAGPVRGTVTFSQVQHGITMIDVQLAGLEHGPNPWHIHEFAGTGADCSAASVGGHYNPPDHPTQGELSTLMGDLRVTSGPADIVTAHTAVTGVTLFGDESIIGRSIVIHKQNGARWVCATIGTDEVQIQRPPQSVREKVTVLFSDDGLAIGLVVTILVLCLLIFLLHVCNTRRAGRDVTTDEMRLRDKVERLERYVDTRLSVFCLVDHRGARITTEFVGTMILAVTVALTGKRSPIAPLAIGFSLMVGIYSGGHISGAHYNPAVTLAMVVRGVMGVQDAMLYVVAQLGGAWFGTLLGFVIVGERNSAYPAKGVNVDNFDAWLAELVLTFALSFTVLNVTTSRAQANNSYFGMAIGFVVISGAISVGGISGGAFNPAIGAMCLMHGEFDDLWIYWTAPPLGAALAGWLFKFTSPLDFGGEEKTGKLEKVKEGSAPLIVEFIGTFMLCFTFAVAASTRGGTSLAPLSIGAMLMSMIYMGAATSGAHYNIAITLAVLLRTLFGATQDRFGAKAATSYIAVQLAGCICGSFVAVVVVGEEHQIGYPAVPAESTGDDGEVVSATDGSRIESPRASALVAEMLATFILVYVVLNVTTVTQLAGNSYFGIAIGMTVTAMGSAFGSVSGGALNPCIGLMGVVTGGGGGDVGDVWIYWVGPITGAIVGTLVFRLMNYEEFHEHPGESKFMAHVAVTDTRDQKYCAHAHNATHPPPPPSPSVPLWSNARPEESADDITDVSRTIPERDTGTATAPQPSEQPTEEI